MESIKIFISGDFAPRLRVRDCILRGDYKLLYNDMLEIIRQSDYAITNLESPLTNTVTPIRKTGPNLIAPTKSVEALKYVPFNLVTLANNHAMDQGKQGLETTIDLLKKNNIDYVGAGLNEEEIQEPKYLNIKGKTIAIINCCENEWSTTLEEGAGCNPLNEIAIYYQIDKAKRHSDYCLLIIHGGHEMYELPSPRMVKLYRWFIDLGVDAVIGHHTHCYGGREVYRGKNIIYSLGNFVFDHPYWKSGPWTEACACVLDITDNGIDAQMIPFRQCNDKVGIQLLKSDELQYFIAMDSEKTDLIIDNERLVQEYSKYLHDKANLFEAYIEPISGKWVLALKKFHVIKSFLSSKKRLLLLNLIRCESHRDVLMNQLKNTSE